MDYPKYSLHLFAGAGGGLLADIIESIRPVCAVEIEKHARQVLARRFPDLAIWDDVRTFRADNPECADAFADLRAARDDLVVAGGFPCQDISCAGRGAKKYDTPTVHGDGGSGRNGAMPKYGQLNPDWEEWLMAWPVGWTDTETPNIRLVWLDPSIDPADYGEIPRITNRRDNRPARVKEIGNGQFPLAAAIAFDWGLCVLEVAV